MSFGASTGAAPEYVRLNGSIPCCMRAAVAPLAANRSTRPDPGAPKTVPIGDVLGTCDLGKQTASFTWLGAVWQQDIHGAKLLTINFNKKPGELHTRPELPF